MEYREYLQNILLTAVYDNIIFNKDHEMQWITEKMLIVKIVMSPNNSGGVP